jgi:putative ABC transport system substrate-binding protein
MDRRRFIVFSLGGLIVAPGSSVAQLARTPPRVGFLGNADAKTQAFSVAQFREGLRDSGLIESQNITVEYRWAKGSTDRLPSVAADLITQNVDVIVASGSPALRALQQLTKTIPVVIVLLIDPVEAGFVASHARPGGNITGLASQYDEIVTKQVQLLAEAIPPLSRIILLRHATTAQAGQGADVGPAAAAAADKLAIKTRLFDVSDAAEFHGAFKVARESSAQAMLVLPSPFLNAHRHELIHLAATYRLPVFYELKTFVRDGGLMSYGPNIDHMFRRSASFVARILKGAKPAELPIERPNKFAFVINLKTARVLGLKFPRSLLLRADELVE